MSEAHPHSQVWRQARLAVFAALTAILALVALPGVAQAKSSSNEVRVMTRNLYLGADLGPAIAAPNFPTFVKRAGDVYNTVNATNFPVRAVSLAREIRKKKADLVGLQEAALWRIDSPLNGPGVPAQTVAYDFIQNLLDELNTKEKGEHGRRYKLVVSQDEFDFETIANTTGPIDPNPPLFGAEIDVRLTMRDAIIARQGAGVATKNAQGGNFNTLLTVPTVAGPITVKRGWVDADASVRGRKFHFVNTHLEAFDRSANPAINGAIREAQAKELVANGGPADSTRRPAVLLGDMNSNVPGVLPGDEKAFQALLDAGFSSRALTPPPFSCCYDSELLNNPNDTLDHTVDHILSDSASVELEDSAVTTTFADGLWSSDHAGVWSALRMPSGKKSGKTN